MTTPARVDARQQADVWFEPGLVLEHLATLTRSQVRFAGGRVRVKRLARDPEGT
ncbi:MAG: hypothetical protein ACM3ML_17350 [Micromonosporaceae bacterium]